MPAGAADAAVGIMDSAYFTGRRELLEFFNSLLDLNLTKIEQTASGAVACQLLDYIFPGSIPVSQINWGARSDFEYIANYKLLQKAFIKHRVQRHVDVEKLIRGRYQDNLEFCQWLKAFFDQSGVNRPDYDPVAVRARGKGGKQVGTGGGKSGSRPVSKPVGATTRRPVSGSATSTRTTTSRPLRERPSAGQSQANRKAEDTAAADTALMKKNEELTTKVSELEQNLVDIEKERDFYFQKLRDIEVMLQVHQEKGEESDPDGLIEKVFKVLYATADDGIVVDDEGEIVGGAEQDLEDALFEE